MVPYRALHAAPLHRQRVGRRGPQDLPLGCNGAGAVSKRWRTRSGQEQGGLPFSRGALFQLLKNPLYVGRVRHKDKVFPGLHPAIVPEDIFQAVQAKLKDNAATRRDRPLRSAGAWLKGKIFDAQGRPMSPSFGYGKSGKPFRYYVSAPPPADRSAANAVSRVSAPQIEDLVADRLKQRGVEAAPAAIDLRVELHAATIHIILPAKRLGVLPLGADEMLHPEPGERVRLVVAVRPVFRGGRTWLVGPSGASPFSTAERDPALIKGLRRAHEHARKHGISPMASPQQLRTASNPPDSHQRNLVRLAFLAPDLQAAILAGSLPPGLTLEQLLAMRLPVSWAKQRQLIFGEL